MELVNTETREMSALDDLAMQARMLVANVNLNLWQLARVFTEAKKMVPHGQFGKWLDENTGVSERTAEDMMAAYKRFQGRPEIEKLGQSKMFKLLPLPEEREEAFLREHDVGAMSTREIQEAVKKARQELQAELDAERRARMDAEERAREAENKQAHIPPELTGELANSRREIEKQKAEAQRLAQVGADAMEEKMRLARENADLRREVQERDELLQEQQEDLNRAQQELLNAQSAIARGDAERVPADQLTADAFAVAVRTFIGTCARMPQMQMIFSNMAQSEKQEYDLLLKTVEKWAKDSRKALDAKSVDGMVIFSA